MGVLYSLYMHSHLFNTSHSTIRMISVPPVVMYSDKVAKLDTQNDTLLDFVSWRPFIIMLFHIIYNYCTLHSSPVVGQSRQPRIFGSRLHCDFRKRKTDQPGRLSNRGVTGDYIDMNLEKV